jgi:hypothetical protein
VLQVFDRMTSQRRQSRSRSTHPGESLLCQQRGTSHDHPRRSKAVKPTLAEIRTQSFTDYINGILLDKDAEDCTIHRDNITGSSEYQDLEQHGTKKAKSKKWKHGIVKITLPLGWWDESGIGSDRTARGPAVSNQNFYRRKCLVPFIFMKIGTNLW